MIKKSAQKIIYENRSKNGVTVRKHKIIKPIDSKKIIKFKFIFTGKNIPQNFIGERSLKIRLKWNLRSVGFS